MGVLTISNNVNDKSGGRPEHAHKKAQQFINTWIEECDLLNI